MKGDARIIELCNKVLYNELTAINQYILHSRLFNHWGFKELGSHEFAESIDEMKHADKLIERILFLDGLPNLQNLGKLLIGESPKEALECDLKLEVLAVADLREGIVYAESIRDFVTRDLFAAILDSEEEHIDWIETQLDIIGRISEPLYLQAKLGE